MPNALDDKSDDKAIAARLKLTRLALGYDLQTNFCEALSRVQPMKIGRWNHYETGEARITLNAALALCERFDLSLDWIYRGKSGGLPGRIIAAIAEKKLGNSAAEH